VQKSIAIFRFKRSQENDGKNKKHSPNKIQHENVNGTDIEQENLLIETLAKLLITSPEDIMLFVTIENFKCKEIKNGLKIFRQNFDGNPKKTNLAHVRLFRALTKYSKFLCERNDKYREIFTKWQDELINLHEQFTDCEGQLDWYERNAKTACGTAENILKCYNEALKIDINSQALSNAFIQVFEGIMSAVLSSHGECNFKNANKSMKINVSSGYSLKYSSLMQLTAMLLSIYLMSFF
jgi:hypothetical protein